MAEADSMARTFRGATGSAFSSSRTFGISFSCLSAGSRPFFICSEAFTAAKLCKYYFEKHIANLFYNIMLVTRQGNSSRIRKGKAVQARKTKVYLVHGWEFT